MDSSFPLRNHWADAQSFGGPMSLDDKMNMIVAVVKSMPIHFLFEMVRTPLLSLIGGVVPTHV